MNITYEFLAQSFDAYFIQNAVNIFLRIRLQTMHIIFISVQGNGNRARSQRDGICQNHPCHLGFQGRHMKLHQHRLNLLPLGKDQPHRRKICLDDLDEQNPYVPQEIRKASAKTEILLNGIPHTQTGKEIHDRCDHDSKCQNLPGKSSVKYNP